MTLSILIHTFNGYKHLWPGCMESWKVCHFAQWHESDIYFGTDLKTDESIFQDGVSVIYSGPGEWSDRLMRLLKQIPSDYILYAQEDMWPAKTTPKLSEMMQIVSEKRLLRLQISPIVPFYNLFSEENTLYFDAESKYLVSHQPSIWKKSFLMDCLRPGETPWQNEYKGTQRLQQTSQIREFIRKKIAIHPCDWFRHMCIKGKVVES